MTRARAIEFIRSQQLQLFDGGALPTDDAEARRQPRALSFRLLLLLLLLLLLRSSSSSPGVVTDTTVGVLACGPAVPPPSSAFVFSDAGQPRDRGPRGRGRARPRARPRARRRDRALGYPLRGRPLLQRGAAGVARGRVGARAARARPRAAQGRPSVLLGVVWGSVGSALPRRGGGARSRGGRWPSRRVRSSPLSVVPGRALREARDPRASPVVGFDLRQLDVQVRRHAVSDVSRRVTPRRRGSCPQGGQGWPSCAARLARCAGHALCSRVVVRAGPAPRIHIYRYT